MQQAHPQSSFDQLDNQIKTLALEQKVPIVALKHHLDRHRELDKQRESEIDAVVEKYRKLGELGLKRVCEIVSGGVIKDDEMKDTEKYLTKDEIENHLEKCKQGNKIQDYWSNAIINSHFGQLVTQTDHPALTSLTQLHSQVTPTSISIWFTFEDNPNFPACTVHRQLLLENGQPIESKGDLIQWKQGKCLTYETKTVANKKTGEKKQVLSGKKKPSLFHFFENHRGEGEEEEDHLKVQAMIFNELANELIPYSLEYYFGLVEGEEEDGDDQDGDNAEEVEVDLRDYEEEDEEPKPRKKQHK